jgi:circadian clock protein KaiC
LAGADAGETALFVSFREGAPHLLRKSASFALNLESALEQRRIEILRFAPVDLDPDEVLSRACESLLSRNAARVVFDSVLELERALPTTRKRSVLAALLEWLRARAVTSLVLIEPHRSMGRQLDFADSPLELLAENILLLRNAEPQGTLRRRLSLRKMRDTEHDASEREYSLAQGGLCVHAATANSIGTEDE